MGEEGLEPSWCNPLAPKASASASFATRPFAVGWLILLLDVLFAT